MNIIPKVPLSIFRRAKAQEAAYTGTDAKARAKHPAALPIASQEELDKARRDGIDLRGRMKPFDRYGRRRVFDVAHHTGPNRAERRAMKRAGYNVPRATNRPLVRGAAR